MLHHPKRAKRSVKLKCITEQPAIKEGPASKRLSIGRGTIVLPALNSAGSPGTLVPCLRTLYPAVAYLLGNGEIGAKRRCAPYQEASLTSRLTFHFCTKFARVAI